MHNRLSVILAATILSGSLSGYFFVNYDPGSWGITYGPGIFFGLTTAALFIWLYRSPIIKLALWLGASIFSWYLALQTAMALSLFNVPVGGGIVGYVMSGFIGALLLSTFFWVLIRKINREQIFLTVATGGIMAVAMILILQGTDSERTARTMVSFVIWQVGVGLALTLKKNATIAG